MKFVARSGDRPQQIATGHNRCWVLCEHIKFDGTYLALNALTYTTNNQLADPAEPNRQILPLAAETAFAGYEPPS
jgi:hypothetical protein